MILEGGVELERKLLLLERKVGKRVVKKAVRAALKPMLTGSKANARSMIGGGMGSLIAKNIQLRAFKKQRKGSYGMSVKIKPDVEEFVYNSKDGKRSFIPAAIEYGHVSRGGGQVAAMPFMRQAAEAWKSVGLQIAAGELRRGIEAAAHGS